MKKGEIYDCRVTTGDGEEIKNGLWEIKSITKKSIKLVRLGEKKEDSYHGHQTFTCKHSIQVWDDGTFTIYPYRIGVPYTFTLLP